MKVKEFPVDELLIMSLKLEVDFIIKHDLDLAHSLTRMSAQNHPNALKILLRFASLEAVPDVHIKSAETARIIIETLLEPEVYLEEVLENLNQHPRIDLKNPLLFYLARGPYGQSREFRKILGGLFIKDPSHVAAIMATTMDPYHLLILSERLRFLAPYVKFLPLRSDSHERIPEHDEWLSLGNAYMTLYKVESGEVTARTRELLEKMFLQGLDTESQSLSFMDEGSKKEFLERKDVYFSTYKKGDE